jgi:hypothetical protein
VAGQLSSQYAARLSLGSTIFNVHTLQEKKKVYTVKKGLRFSRPQPGCHLQNSPSREKFNIPSWESFVSDIPAGDRKIAQLFYSVEDEEPVPVLHLNNYCLFCLQILVI